MILAKTAVLATILAAAASTAVVAAPTRVSIAPVGVAPAGLSQVKSHRRSYGTGYHGRGTRTGGPAGGLPSRN